MKKGEIDMGRIIKNLLLLLCVQSAMLALVGCHHKELCLHHPHEVILKVEFDWRNSPDANPQGMCAFFYPVDGGSPRRFDFKGTKGGEIEITTGKYNVITFNNDTEGVMFGSQGSFENHSAYTREGDLFEPVLGSAANSAPRAKGEEDQRVTITPDMLWGCTSTEVEITDSGIKYTCIPFTDKDNPKTVEVKEHVITLYPYELICHYSYEIRNVSNIEHATQMCASITGMASGLTFSSVELFRECVTHPLEAHIDKVNSTITGEFFTFGHHLANADPHKMLLYVWMDSGEKFYFGEGDTNFDVTSQVHNAANPKRVHLIIDGLDLPKPILNGNGFKPTIDDWQNEYYDIMM